MKIYIFLVFVGVLAASDMSFAQSGASRIQLQAQYDFALKCENLFGIAAETPDAGEDRRDRFYSWSYRYGFLAEDLGEARGKSEDQMKNDAELVSYRLARDDEFWRSSTAACMADVQVKGY